MLLDLNPTARSRPLQAATRACLRALVLWLLLMLPAMAGSTCGVDSAPLGAAEGERILDHAELSVLRDPGAKLGIDAVSAPENASRFQPLGNGLALGFTTDAVWLKVCIRRAAQAAPDWWLEFRGPYADDVRLYSRRGDGNAWHESRAGDRYPMRARELPYRTIVFPVRLPSEAPGVFYLRIETSSMMTTAITAWTPGAFRIQAQKDLLFIGLMLGVLLAMFLANVVNGLWTGQRLYLGFAGLTLIIFTSIISGYGLLAQYLLPDDTWICHTVLNMSLCALFGATLLPTRKPLRMDEYFPRINRALPYFAAAMALAGFSTLFDAFVYVMPWVRASMLLFVALGTVAAIKTLLRGHAYAAWICLAFAFYAIPMLIGMTRALGLFSLNINYEPTAPAVVIYALLLHFGILAELRAQQASRQSAEQAAEVYHQLVSQEEQLRGEQTTFFAYVAHELRTPLGILLTGLSNLRRALVDTDNVTRIDRLNDAAQRMRGLINRHLRLQNLARTDFEPYRTDESPELPALEALEAQRQLHPGRKFEYVCPDTKGAQVSMDAELLTLALSNLLDNAAKYAFEGSPVRFEIDARADGLRYRVINAGPGLPPELANKAFGMFQRTKGTGRDKGGFGIGLSLAAHVAAAHGGSLASTQEGPLTTFTLTLPVEPGSASISGGSVAAASEHTENTC